MKKIITLLFLIPFLSLTKGHAQTWTANLASLGSGSETVKAIGVDPSGTIYAGGTFKTPVKYFAKWNGASWEAVGGGVSGPVYAIKIKSSSDMYIGGKFDSTGTLKTNNFAKWNGVSWSSIGGGFNDTVKCIYVGADIQGTLYAGGYFSQAGPATTTMLHISKLVNGTWTAIGSGIGATVNAIQEFGTPTSVLYAGCNDVSAPLKSFNGSTWIAPSGQSTGGSIYALAKYSNNLYVGGDFSNPYRSAARWDGANWNSITTNFSFGQRVNAFLVYGNTLLIAGNFTGVGQAPQPNYIGQITGNGIPLKSITSSTNLSGSAVYAIGFVLHKVIAGGSFTSPAANISITSPSTINVNELSSIVSAKNFYPNPVINRAHLSITTTERLKNPELKIFNVQSQLIENIQMDMMVDNDKIEFTFDCGNMSKGNYYYMLTENGQGVLSDKFIVQ